jgi:hypothetical protein
MGHGFSRTPAAPFLAMPPATLAPAHGSPRQRLTTRCHFLSDAVPTGYMGAELCGIQPGDTVAV